MNLLVEELALRCKEYKLQVDGARVDFDYKKFAELIVKECLHIIDDEGAGEGGCIRAMIRIQEQFGVEE